MSSQDNRDNSSSGAVNRRNILLVSTTLGVASALGSTTLAQITRAQAQTAQEPVHIYGDNAMSPHAELQVRLSVAAQFPVHFFLENIAVRQLCGRWPDRHSMSFCWGRRARLGAGSRMRPAGLCDHGWRPNRAPTGNWRSKREGAQDGAGVTLVGGESEDTERLLD